MTFLDNPFRGDTPTTMREFELIRQLRDRLGLFTGAMPISPKAAWEEAMHHVEMLQRLYGDVSTALRKTEHI